MNEAIRKLLEQQSKVRERSPQWMVAEQLMDICRAEPESAAILAQDLDVPEMSIVEAEKKLISYRMCPAPTWTSITMRSTSCPRWSVV